MSYELHITRADEPWFMQEEGFITLEEVEALPELPEGFSFDRSGVVESKPIDENGTKLVANVGTFLVYRYGDGEEDKVHIYFDSDRDPYFNARAVSGVQDKAIPALTELAHMLGAKLQGDDGELYDTEHPDGYFPEDAY